MFVGCVLRFGVVQELEELKVREQTTLSGPQIINVVTAAGQRSRAAPASAPAAAAAAVPGSTPGSSASPQNPTAGAGGPPQVSSTGPRVDSHPYPVTGPSETVSNTFVVREGKASVGSTVVSNTP